MEVGGEEAVPAAANRASVSSPEKALFHRQRKEKVLPRRRKQFCALLLPDPQDLACKERKGDWEEHGTELFTTRTKQLATQHQ